MLKIAESDYHKAIDVLMNADKSIAFWIDLKTTQEEDFISCLSYYARTRPTFCEGIIVGLMILDAAQKRQEVQYLEELEKK